MQFLVFLLLLLCSTLSKGQIITCQNKTLNDPKKTILLNGMPNKVEFSGIKFGPGIKIASRFCQVKMDSLHPAIFYLTPKFLSQKPDTIKIIDNKKVIKQFIYQIEAFPTASVTINGMVSGSTVSTENILREHVMQITQPKKELCNCKYEVRSYEIEFSKGRNIFTFSIQNNEWSEQLIQAIKKAGKGTKLIFSAIKLKSDVCGEKRMPPTVIILE